MSGSRSLQLAPAFDHVAHRLLGTEELAADVQVVAAVELLLGHIQEVDRCGDPGVVHQAVQAAQEGGRLINHPTAFRHDLQVALDGDCAPAHRGDMRHRFARAFRAAAVVQRYVRTHLRQRDGDALSDAGAGAGDENQFSPQVA